METTSLDVPNWKGHYRTGILVYIYELGYLQLATRRERRRRGCSLCRPCHLTLGELYGDGQNLSFCVSLLCFT